jgi:hypothetical protein
MNVRAGGARVVLEPRSLRSLRGAASLLRLAIAAVVLAFVAAGARAAIDPPTPSVRVVRSRPSYDPSGAWAAEQLVRSYLTWGPGTAGDGAVQPAPGSSDSLVWLEIAAARAIGPATTDYVVAADTSLHGVVYVELVLDRRASGYALARYPAFISAPPAAGGTGAIAQPRLPIVANGQLERVLERALGHYLAGDTVDLAADLAPGASVMPPALRLVLGRVERLSVEPSGAVLATVVALDREGNAYTLSYSVGLTLAAGRWELTSINQSS